MEAGFCGRPCATQKFLPYAGVVQRFLAFMALNEEEHLELRAVTTDTIGTVAIALGRQAFEVPVRARGSGHAQH